MLAIVSVLDGVFDDVSVNKAVVFEVLGTSFVSFETGLLDATELIAGDVATIEIFGHSFEVDTGGGFASVGFGSLSALSGTLRGTLDSGDPFEASFSQGGGSFTGSIVLVPEPATGLLLIAGLVGLAMRRQQQN